MQDGLPVAYASRALTDTEQRWAQIEKELMAIVFACEKFHYYVYGRDVLVQSDHRPLEAVFAKSLHQTTPRLQRMLLRLLRYRLTVQYTPGKLMYVAHTLSRAYLPFESSADEQELAEDNNVHASTLPAWRLPREHQEKMEQLREETAQDLELSQLMLCLRNGFQADNNPSHSMQHYKKFADEMYIMYVHIMYVLIMHRCA